MCSWSSIDPLLIELIKVSLNHGVYSTRAVPSADEVETTVARWQPHLVILDKDLGRSQITALLGHRTSAGTRLPVTGLTRLDDLKTTLAAFDAGVDDLLTIPFAPEEPARETAGRLARATFHRNRLRPRLPVPGHH